MCCCCLPTPLTHICGGSPIIPLFGPPASLSLHLASSSITPAGSVHKSMGDSVMRIWVQLKRWCVSCVWVLQRGHSGDGCDLASTLCKYDLRKGDLFILNWARVRQVRWGSISWCCQPTPMTLASGGSPIFPLVVHQPAFPSIWPAVQSHRRGLSTNPGVTMWCVCGCS